MAGKNIQTICVTDKDCARNEEFKALMASVPNGQMLNFYTNDLEELAVIAKYRILPVPTILVLSNNKVVARIVNPPRAELISELIQNINLSLK